MATLTSGGDASLYSHLLHNDEGLLISNQAWMGIYLAVYLCFRILYLCFLPRSKTLSFEKWWFPSSLFVLLGVLNWTMASSLTVHWHGSFARNLALSVFSAAAVEIIAWHFYIRKRNREAAGFTPQHHNEREANRGYQLRMAKRRIVFYMVFAGSSCMVSYYAGLVERTYEYKGPMRVTHVSMNVLEYDDMFAPDNVSCGKASITSFRLAAPVITIEWGKAWGCRSETNRWNTNWPPYTPCSKLICPKDDNATPGCSCYSNEESARNASWECLRTSFDLSKLKSSSSSNNNDTLLFDPAQPPWEDPTWPTIQRYGNCAGNVGLSMDVDYVDQKLKMGRVRRNTGTTFLLLATAFVVYGDAWGWNLPILL